MIETPNKGKEIALHNLNTDKAILNEQIKNLLLKVRRKRSQLEIVRKEIELITYNE